MFYNENKFHEETEICRELLHFLRHSTYDIIVRDYIYLHFRYIWFWYIWGQYTSYLILNFDGLTFRKKHLQYWMITFVHGLWQFAIERIAITTHKITTIIGHCPAIVFYPEIKIHLINLICGQSSIIKCYDFFYRVRTGNLKRAILKICYAYS